jgi:hypothetical protein
MAARLADQIPRGAITSTRIIADGDVALVEWCARGMGACVEEGVDTLVVRDGRIVAQTVHYRLHPLPH